MRSLSLIQQALRDGHSTCTELVHGYLEQIETNRHLNAFIEVWTEDVLQWAARTDAALAAGDTMPPLFGAVLSLKDNLCYAGHTVTASSKILEGFSAPYSATAVQRLLDAGAMFIGRTNCDQFGMGSSNENSVYGPVLNAADPQRVPGGSSGGAAVSVQTGACLAAIGSDTGGSVRQPAGFCGLWGFKPTYGAISRYGLIAYGSSFDQVGVIANNAHDIAQLTAVMAGADDFDSTAPEREPLISDFQLHLFSRQDLSSRKELSSRQGPKRFVFFEEMFDSPGLDAGVKQLGFEFLEKLKSAGHHVEAASFDLLDVIIPAYYVLTTAEASSNLARFDGIRYGYRSKGARNLEETYIMSRSEGFSNEVKRRILLGTFVLSSGYYDAYYGKAQQARRLIRDRVAEVLKTADAIVMPVAPGVAWKFGEKSADPVAMYLSDIYTVLANLCGMPALALPAGKHPENGMPVGMQLMAAPWSDGDLLALSAAL
ncbi:MAG: Asp-tRNA(Asn)/Glu-tRNA(Gln) amidotransferase subunit GatA [Saprospiraceae bacterium]|nr:Asp-tRNA(Asn)/Glu-tRNA(Gln) amidotransferase subunit GatA [Saprospiraceae bacterium]